MPVNCEQLKKDDIHNIMENVLSVFPITEINFYMPKWAEMLPTDHWLKSDLITSVRNIFEKISRVKDANASNFVCDNEYVKRFKLDNVDMKNGTVTVNVEFDDTYYYKILSDLIGVPITGSTKLISTLKELAAKS